MGMFAAYWRDFILILKWKTAGVGRLQVKPKARIYADSRNNHAESMPVRP
jgi:hypothetical protein